ncbi:phage terminase large subunit family protein [Endozoicomonas euniceicola]|uniref:Phage terminase large subunit family protein n=1 Tax=Endozoicomonas euniceicola TaxID=1234143 RepID=A0ABY6GNG4_9GAMM|nr:phage terminase large subunit family protein [Endozoicomonas euniceicola]UYM14268.1 phage terminase large subunit family protein [Endozoicomonas euniceicola]
MNKRSSTTHEFNHVLLDVLSCNLKRVKPPPELLPNEWAEQFVQIPAGNAKPGPVRFANAPFQVEPMNMVVNPDCYRITLMWGAQTGKSQVQLMAMGFCIDHAPQSQMMMQPSEGDLQTWLNAKFDPMVESTTTIKEKMAKPRSREGVNNQKMKSYPGGFLMFAWSGSPKTMRGRSAPKIFCDEVDGYEVTAEGNPVSLLWQRAATFGDQRLLFETSTPTVKRASFIETSFEAGDQRRFYVPCPHCKEKQTLEWSGVDWDKERNDKGETIEHYPETARYICKTCGAIWNDAERFAAIRNGEWIGAKPFKGHASYHLSELYSMFRRLRDIVISFLEKNAANDLQTFMNVSLAETWEEGGERVDHHVLMKRLEQYLAEIPAGVVAITAGVDVQRDRLELELVGWGMGYESWSLDYQVFYGDPTLPETNPDSCWYELNRYREQVWQHEHGHQMKLLAVCIDSSDQTDHVYNYCKGKAGRRVFPIKGVSGWGRPVVASPNRKRNGRKNVRPVDLFPVGVDEAKSIVMRRLGIKEPGPGYCHFPDDRDQEYFEQLTAEKLITRYRKGFPHREWHKTRERNEALDCRVYALAALQLMNVNLDKLARRMEAEKQEQEQEPEEQPATEPKPEKPPEEKKRRRIRVRSTRKRFR